MRLLMAAALLALGCATTRAEQGGGAGLWMPPPGVFLGQSGYGGMGTSYTGNFQFNGNLVVTGTSDFRGAIFNGTGDIVANDHFEPVSTNTYDLGVTSFRWRALYVGTITSSNFNFTASGFNLTNASLTTCASNFERYIAFDTTSGGTGTTAVSRYCVCTSDGAASPTYTWRNLYNGNNGTATTCPP